MQKHEQEAIEAGRQWAHGVLNELVANGPLADNPLERLRHLFQRNFPKSEAELERAREVLSAAGIPQDALDFSRADMPITDTGLKWLKQWRASEDVS